MQTRVNELNTQQGMLFDYTKELLPVNKIHEPEKSSKLELHLSKLSTAALAICSCLASAPHGG
jgi:hypothetical protein